MLVTSSYVDNIFIGENITGPVAFSNCVISTSGGNEPPQGAGYRIISAKSPNVSIIGGSVHDTAGHGIDISGNSSMLVTGVGISAIKSGKNADGIRIAGSGNVTLTGVSITDVKATAIRTLADFSGVLTFSGISTPRSCRSQRDSIYRQIPRASPSPLHSSTEEKSKPLALRASPMPTMDGVIPTWPSPTSDIPSPCEQVRAA